MVDNTFATPYFQQPFELGADIVVHSVTKYLGGHSDTIQGAALAKEAAVFEPIKFLQNATGAVPSPFDCWLTLRGLKTLELRMQRHEENAIAIANSLKGHPLVRQVYFPGLPEHPGHEIAKKQMTGFGGMVSFELAGTIEEVVAFCFLAALFHSGRKPGRGESSAVPSGDDDARIDSRGDAGGTGAFGFADSFVARLRERERPGGGFARGTYIAGSSAKSTKGGCGQCPLRLRECSRRGAEARGGPALQKWK